MVSYMYRNMIHIVRSPIQTPKVLYKVQTWTSTPNVWCDLSIKIDSHVVRSPENRNCNSDKMNATAWTTASIGSHHFPPSALHISTMTPSYQTKTIQKFADFINLHATPIYIISASLAIHTVYHTSSSCSPSWKWIVSFQNTCRQSYALYHQELIDHPWSATKLQSKQWFFSVLWDIGCGRHLWEV